AGHEAWILQADSFKYDKDDRIKATARHAPVKRYQSAGSYLKELQSERARRELISVSDLDVLFLRSNPTIEVGPRAWAQSIGINFGRIAMKHGVIVVNDPSGLANAMNKMYFQLYPEEVRPRTIITRS
ncbi:MAG TPA: glutathione synthase, partial [Candidatus Melainabacteria bacterium]|nr:glutathione synthase [Candidatus Melainabacteria bacterium]